MHIIQAINKIIQHEPLLFTTPGHSGGKSVLPEYKELVGKKVFKADLSEIEGLDNLQNPSGIIKNSLLRSSEIYGSKSTFYLVNGSTSGIIALMLSTVTRGDKVLVSRNIHKSVINALTLSGAHPVWINPEWETEWDIPSCVNPEKIKQKLEKNPDIKAVWITSPTYEGIVSDIESISKICKEKDVLLIVDEAHGALWNFSGKLPVSAIHLGADACVQSLHKTGSCFTQGAVLHLSQNSGINHEKIQQSLGMINTTSPSYLILSSIEASIEYLNSSEGRRNLDELLDNIEKTKSFIKMNIDIGFLENCEKYQHDPTKIFLGLNGVSGYDLSDILLKKFKVEVELDNNKGILALTGIGTTEKKLQKLAFSLIKAEKLLQNSSFNAPALRPFIEPEVVYTPSEAFYKKSRKIEVSKSLGLVSKETIVNYPPGIPLIIAGETIKPEHLELFDVNKEIEIILD
jgi:arginine/lysine/ornithine decarboxylase